MRSSSDLFQVGAELHSPKLKSVSVPSYGQRPGDVSRRVSLITYPLRVPEAAQGHDVTLGEIRSV